jgi:hypothetical protein
MSFGQTGPPASTKQVAYLQSLLQNEGFDTFREARHHFDLTQRQAGGKFTTREASELIDRLVNGTPDEEPAPRSKSSAKEPEAASNADEKLAASQELLLRGIPAHLLVAELERRGYTVRHPA